MCTDEVRLRKEAPITGVRAQNLVIRHVHLLYVSLQSSGTPSAPRQRGKNFGTIEARRRAAWNHAEGGEPVLGNSTAQPLRDSQIDPMALRTDEADLTLSSLPGVSCSSEERVVHRQDMREAINSQRISVKAFIQTSEYIREGSSRLLPRTLQTHLSTWTTKKLTFAAQWRRLRCRCNCTLAPGCRSWNRSKITPLSAAFGDASIETIISSSRYV